MKKFEQDYKYLYKQKVEELKVLEKALQLACDDTDNYWNEKSATEKKMSLCDYFIDQAKKEVEE